MTIHEKANLSAIFLGWVIGVLAVLLAFFTLSVADPYKARDKSVPSPKQMERALDEERYVSPVEHDKDLVRK